MKNVNVKNNKEWYMVPNSYPATVTNGKETMAALDYAYANFVENGKGITISKYRAQALMGVKIDSKFFSNQDIFLYRSVRYSDTYILEVIYKNATVDYYIIPIKMDPKDVQTLSSKDQKYYELCKLSDPTVSMQRDSMKTYYQNMLYDLIGYAYKQYTQNELHVITRKDAKALMTIKIDYKIFNNIIIGLFESKVKNQYVVKVLNINTDDPATYYVMVINPTEKVNSESWELIGMVARCGSNNRTQCSAIGYAIMKLVDGEFVKIKEEYAKKLIKGVLQITDSDHLYYTKAKNEFILKSNGEYYIVMLNITPEYDNYIQRKQKFESTLLLPRERPIISSRKVTMPNYNHNNPFIPTYPSQLGRCREPLVDIQNEFLNKFLDKAENTIKKYKKEIDDIIDKAIEDIRNL